VAYGAADDLGTTATRQTWVALGQKRPDGPEISLPLCPQHRTLQTGPAMSEKCP